MPAGTHTLETNVFIHFQTVFLLRFSAVRRPHRAAAAAFVGAKNQVARSAAVRFGTSRAMTDPYNNPDALPSATIDAIITRLEERGRHPFFLAAINEYAAVLERDRKLSILELGCGTGVVIRHIETLVHPSSALRAADISLQFLQGPPPPERAVSSSISQFEKPRKIAFQSRLGSSGI
jgi:SAM-dependent methyltransferase